MGIQYGNLTLQGVHREDLINYLSKVSREAYVSANVNGFITIYDRAIDGADRKDVANLTKLDSRARAIVNQYRYGSYFTLVCLAHHLSRIFSCSALAVHVYDGSIFWYYLSKNGEMLDEYTTCGDDNWKPGKVLDKFPAQYQIKGGNSNKLCTAFGKEMTIDQVETILRKPDDISDETSLLNSPRNEALLKVESYSSPIIRHEALARYLGICSGFVVGINYLAIDTGEFPELWEDFCHWEDDDVPRIEEVEPLLIKTNCLTF
ncbi:hypothetical protein [Scytonema sp. NUACC26]|uniref:hypothetical protein n=1 Tax=Scytonema sp. NUACC26 TaxID=3140176 RepID=UPI0034DBCF4A